MKKAYLISLGDMNNDGIMADTFEEAYEFVQKTINQLNKDANYIGKYIFITEYFESHDNNFVLHDDSIKTSYMII